MEGAISDVPFPPLPLRSLESRDPDGLHRLGVASSTVSSDRLRSDAGAAAVTSACRVPPELEGVLVERAMGIGDRRDILLGADRPLGRLAPGTPVLTPDLRTTALMRAHRPTLEVRPGWTQGAESPLEPGAGERRPEIRPLWPDPAVESRGDLLEPDSWLPAPGQGVAVLLHAPGATARFAAIPTDPDAEAVLRAERAVGRAFSFAVPLVRAQLFGRWLSIHAVVLTPEGDRAVRARVRGDRHDPVGVAERLVEVLVERGGLLLGAAGPSEGLPVRAPAR